MAFNMETFGKQIYHSMHINRVILVFSSFHMVSILGETRDWPNMDNVFSLMVVMWQVRNDVRSKVVHHIDNRVLFRTQPSVWRRLIYPRK